MNFISEGYFFYTLFWLIEFIPVTERSLGIEFETVSLGLLARTHLKVVKPSLNLKLIPRLLLLMRILLLLSLPLS